MTEHATHHEQLNRLKRIQGQVGGLIRMIEDERYCLDLLSQLRAVSAALRKVELGVLKTHADHCVRQAAESDDPLAVREKVDELIAVLDRYGT
jgi:DNA-binding FrmR family transcriptional regulator